jgi:hypothetical protein
MLGLVYAGKGGLSSKDWVGEGAGCEWGDALDARIGLEGIDPKTRVTTARLR